MPSGDLIYSGDLTVGNDGDLMYSGDLNSGNILIGNFYLFFIQGVAYSDALYMVPFE